MDQGVKEGERSLKARNTGENKMAVNKDRVTPLTQREGTEVEINTNISLQPGSEKMEVK